MAKELKIWNGRGDCCKKGGDPQWEALKFNENAHAFVAAYSRSDARRVIEGYCGKLPTDAELKHYWSEGAWGRAMDGVPVERGLWIQFSRTAKPVRVV